MEFNPLSHEQSQAFERDGFLVIPDAIPADLVERLLEVADRLYQEGVSADGLNVQDYWYLRNCLLRDDVFLELLDWPTTVPLVVQLLNHNIQLMTSHLIMRPPSPPGTTDAYKQSNWHRDGGTAPSDLGTEQPRMFIKVAYWLSDLSRPGRGAIRLIPGSNHWPGQPPHLEEGRDPEEAVEVQVEAGSAVLFENRTLHAVGPNFSELTRKSLFFGYSYRWLRPMDYITMPPELLARCDPIQRQLLGDCTSPMGYQIPHDEDVPLRSWLEENTGTVFDPGVETPGASTSDGVRR